MKCKFPDKPCTNSYESHGKKPGTYCRLAEWKRKKAFCPYDKKIHSRSII